jgi:hypothetical protein
MGQVIRYDALTGAFIDIFVEEGSGGLGEPTFIIFAPTGKNAGAGPIQRLVGHRRAARI